MLLALKPLLWAIPQRRTCCLLSDVITPRGQRPIGLSGLSSTGCSLGLFSLDPLGEDGMKPATGISSQPTRKAPLGCAFLQHYPDGPVTLAILHQWTRYLGPLPGRGQVTFTACSPTTIYVPWDSSALALSVQPEHSTQPCTLGLLCTLSPSRFGNTCPTPCLFPPEQVPLVIPGSPMFGGHLGSWNQVAHECGLPEYSRNREVALTYCS